MKTLSIRQPWAWLIINGHKNVENRTWPTKHRGRFFVHAGQKIDKEGLEWVKQNMPQIELPETFETGGVVGIARINDCVTDLDSPWFFGEYGFVITDAASVDFFQYKGRLGFFNVLYGDQSK
jgi:hypothetical protein